MQGSQSKNLARDSKPTVQKKKRKATQVSSFFARYSAPRCRSHSLCLAKKEWSGRTGGAEGKWREGVPLEEDDRRHRSAHLSDEEKKKKLSKFFFSLDRGQFRSRGEGGGQGEGCPVQRGTSVSWGRHLRTRRKGPFPACRWNVNRSAEKNARRIILGVGRGVCATAV